MVLPYRIRVNPRRGWYDAADETRPSRVAIPESGHGPVRLLVGLDRSNATNWRERYDAGSPLLGTQIVEE